MKTLFYHSVQIALIVLSGWTMSGCSKDDFKPTVQRIGIIEAFDAGNEGNSTDIRVRFGVVNAEGVREFRILVVPEGEWDMLHLEGGVPQLTPDSYHTLPVVAGEDQFSIRLSLIMDVNSDPIRNSIDYVIGILMIGEEIDQLSIFSSNVIELTPQGIFDGYYTGILCCPVITTNPIRPDLIIELDISGSGSAYNGTMEIRFDAGNNPNVPPMFSGISFELEQNQIPAFVLTDFNGEDEAFVETVIMELSDCDGTLTEGTGSFSEDLDLRITFDICSDPDYYLQLTRTIRDEG